MRAIKFLVIILLLALGLVACTPQQQYRTKANICLNQLSTPTNECDLNALQRVNEANQNYLLGFIEFDDQGLIFDRQQAEAIINTIYQESVNNDLLITVFMHGWQHNAAPGDENIETFRSLLLKLTELENQLSIDNQEPARQVVGVYLGWRGRSLSTPVIDNLTFWDRQKVARKIGDNGLGEILSRLERIKLDKEINPLNKNRTKLAIIGNGLGGTAIYQSVAPILKNRFLKTADSESKQGDVTGFGDSIILINPTISALQFSSLSDMATARSNYFGSQRPVFTVLTSETDYVNKMFFSFGRRMCSLLEENREIKRWNSMMRKNEIFDENKININAIGNFTPYETHYLHMNPNSLITDPNNLKENFYKVYQSWILDYPRSQIEFNGSVLERNNYSAGRNPYLVVQVNRDLINDHDDLSNERTLEFIKELIMISSHNPKNIKKVYYDFNNIGR